MLPQSIVREKQANGMVWIACSNRRVPLISLNFFLLAGKDQNPDRLPGLATMTSRLLNEGSRNFPGLRFSEEIEKIGVEFSSFVEREITGVSLQFLPEHLEPAVMLLAEMVRRPEFSSRRFEQERARVQNHVRSLEDDPQVVCSQLFNFAIYEGSPLQHPTLGTLESLQAMSLDDLKKFHRGQYSPERSCLIGVGDLDAERLFSICRRHFADWSNPETESLRTFRFQRQSTPKFVERRMDKEQTVIYLGHLGVPREHPDFYALQVLDAILGGGPGFASRIPRLLRDELGLAYSTFSDLTGSSGIHPGRFVAFISTSPENARRAVSELSRQIERIRSAPVDEEELAVAQEFLTGSFVFEFQSNGNLARFLLNRELFGLPVDFPSRYPEWIRQITRKRILQVARRHLDAVNYTLVVVGPTGANGHPVLSANFGDSVP